MEGLAGGEEVGPREAAGVLVGGCGLRGGGLVLGLRVEIAETFHFHFLGGGERLRWVWFCREAGEMPFRACVWVGCEAEIEEEVAGETSACDDAVAGRG